jgi:integrase
MGSANISTRKKSSGYSRRPATIGRAIGMRPSSSWLSATGCEPPSSVPNTRALQHYLGHKNIQHTVRYTELSPQRFRDFWKD